MINIVLGIEVPSKEDMPKKRPVYDTKKKKKSQQKTGTYLFLFHLDFHIFGLTFFVQI